jgi:hypothetical protein
MALLEIKLAPCYRMPHHESWEGQIGSTIMTGGLQFTALRRHDETAHDHKRRCCADAAKASQALTPGRPCTAHNEQVCRSDLQFAKDCEKKQVSIMRNPVMESTVPVALALLVSLGAQTLAHAQGRRASGGPPPSAQAAAPVDFTGYWESMVTDEDWVYRMVTPRPGDSAGVPLKTIGLQVMDTWDPAKDTATGQQCKSYGAPAIMRVPGHLHVTWQDEQTLKIETDAGQQTRLLHFAKSDADQGSKSLQGYSVAQWEFQRPPGRAAAMAKPLWGALKVSTTNLSAGYLRKNGIPYSDQAQLQEYFDLVKDSPDDDGETLMILTSTVTDPVYLFEPFVTDENFLKLPSDQGWQPSACSAMW